MSKSFNHLSKVIIVLITIQGFQSKAQTEQELEAQVANIFEATCAKVGCHLGPNAQMGMELSRENFYASAVDEPSTENPNLKRINPGHPELSYMIKKLRGAPDIIGLQMPMTGEISEEDITTIENWIKSIETVDQSRKQLVEDDEVKPFASWQVINLPTTQTTPKGTGLFRISHRFVPPLSAGGNALFGLDGSGIIFLGMSYAFTDNFQVLLGRSNSRDDFELNAKYRFMDQNKDGTVPISLSVQTGFNLVTENTNSDTEKLKYIAQVTASRLFFEKFGVTVVPGILINPNEDIEDEDVMITLGLGGRWNFHKRLSWLFEWVPIVSGYSLSNTTGLFNRFDSWGTGFEIATGGHSFQIVVSNSLGLASDQYLRGGDLDPEDFFDGDIRLGFNIYRVLNYKKLKNK